MTSSPCWTLNNHQLSPARNIKRPLSARASTALDNIKTTLVIEQAPTAFEHRLLHTTSTAAAHKADPPWPGDAARGNWMAVARSETLTPWCLWHGFPPPPGPGLMGSCTHRPVAWADPKARAPSLLEQLPSLDEPAGQRRTRTLIRRRPAAAPARRLSRRWWRRAATPASASRLSTP